MRVLIPMAHNVCPEQADILAVSFLSTESPHLESLLVDFSQSSCVQRKQAGWMASMLFLEKVGFIVC